MIYDIRHVTTYRYDAPVSSARCTLRLLPADDEGQRVFDSGLEVSPEPSTITQRTDFFGTRIANVTIEKTHRELRITALSRVEVERRETPAPALTPPWEDVRQAAFSSAQLGPLAPAHFLFPSRLVPLHIPATKYAAESFKTGRTIVEAATELMRRIRDDFKYDPKATAVSTPLSEAFEARGGVCQDFAHIMIAGLRGLGLPSAYVSGYIRTLPPPGKPRLVGADASHAWVSLWCGDIFGWLDFDPTNAVLAGNDHIVIARGRDYADVSPIDGVILASGNQELSVSVDVAPSQRMASDPPPIARELV
ncbi:MAG: transglutaminase domain protein [Hyphomicrobiales bacterium]|jgi:transglutaminase-like putative cysteine protease|nr:transglutaminase domain protein [Hyphomicrobiales bacterium]